MIEWIASVNGAVNNFIWGVPAIICIVGVGLLLTFRTGCIQVRKFREAMHATLGKIFERKSRSPKLGTRTNLEVT